MNYQDRAVKVLGLFLTDYTDDELNECSYGAYTDEKFSDTHIAPLKKLNDNVLRNKKWKLNYINRGANNYCITIQLEDNELFNGKFAT